MAGTLVTGDLITSARDLHTSFNERRHPDPVLLRALSRYNRRLLADIIRLDPSQSVVQLDTALPLADFNAGIPITALKYPFGCEVWHASHKHHPVEIVPWREHTAYRGAVYLINSTLYLTGTAKHWDQWDTLRFFYVVEPAALPVIDKDALATTMAAIPDAAEDTLVNYLAHIMAQRTQPDEPAKPDPVWFRGQWQESEKKFLDEMARNTQATSSVIREVT